MIDTLRRRTHLRRMLAARTTPSDRAARVALPAPASGSQGDAGSPQPWPRRLRLLLDVTPPVPAETVHNGSDDLFVFRPSVVEVELATRWRATGCPGVRDELYRVCQSEDRAAAITEKVYIDRRALAADELLARAFGTERPS
ncbi:hypothetical protein UFOVP314_9 [uncultured Caudovirales phage]|uniref:Uncharacterized protein n=1 Tax=uncultured Caudovirales phage TaxID=2100421 RepID=A0A6J5LVA5_9CAUD|nr:hypothetical protein UFOVP314_9 [uncultured Caudovirales phage]